MKNFNRKFTTLLSITFTLFISQSFAQLSIHVNTSSNAVYFNNTEAYNLPVYDMNLVSSTPWGLTTSSGIVFDYTFGCSTQTLGDGSSAFMCYTKSCIWDQYANGLTDLNGISIFSNSSGGGLHHNYQSIDYSWNDQNNGLPLEVNVISSGGGSKNVSPGNAHIAYMAPQTIDYIYVEVDMGSGMVPIPVYINGQLLEQDCAGTWGGSLVNDACGVCDGNNSSCSGCTSSWANNYDQDAILNDGSCVLSGCTDQTALNYNQNATDSDGSCIDAILGCMDSEAVNYDANANTDNGLCRPYTLADVEEAEEAAYAAGAASVTPEDGISQADVDAGFAAGAASITPEDGITQADVTNATPLSLNIPLSLPEGWSLFGYSCIDPIDVIEGFSDVVSDIEIVKDEMGLSYLPLWTYNAIGDLKYGEGYQIKLTESIDDLYFCSTLVTKVVGCTEPTAFNYNSLANTDDQSCEEVVYGCTTSNAFNYNMDANTDDESCIQVINGCMDESADNYNMDANTDDESCIQVINGCMEESACNFDSLANTAGVCSNLTYSKSEFFSNQTLYLTQSSPFGEGLMYDGIPLALNTCLDEDNDANGYLYNGFAYRNNFIVSYDASTNAITVDNYDDASCQQYANSFSLTENLEPVSEGATSFEVNPGILYLTQSSPFGGGLMYDGIPLALNTCLDEDNDANGYLYNGFAYRNNFIVSYDASTNSITVDNYDDASCQQYANTFYLSETTESASEGATSFEVDPEILYLTQSSPFGEDLMYDGIPLALNTCLDEDNDANGYMYNGFAYRNNFIVSYDASTNSITVDNYDDANCQQYANSFSLTENLEPVSESATSFEVITETSINVIYDAIPLALNTCIDENNDANGYLYNGFAYRNNFIISYDPTTKAITVDNYDDASCQQYANSFTIFEELTDLSSNEFECE